jgi:voltage-gated potassium channel
MFWFVKKAKNKILAKKTIDYQVSDEDKNTLFEKTNTKLWLYANYLIVFLIFVSIFLVALDTIPWFSKEYHSIIFVVDLFISIVFAIEYFYRWKYSSNKLKFPFRLLNIFDLLSFAPFFYLVLVYWIDSYTIFAIFRIFRVFRIFELIEKIPIALKLLRWFKTHKIEYLAAIFVISIVLVVFSTIIYLLEFNFWNKEVFSSIPHTLWWWVVTMTTVWYGDMVPSLGISKFLAWFLMFLGPMLVTILSTITVIIFIESTKIIDLNWKNKICNKCWTINENDAKFCKNCWKKI